MKNLNCQLNIYKLIKWIRHRPLYGQFRRYGIANTIRRLYYRRMLGRLKKVELARQSIVHSCEVHILTSGWDWDMALWAIHSFYHCANVDWPLVIHDGGGLGSKEFSCLMNYFPTARIVQNSESNQIIGSFIGQNNGSATSFARNRCVLMRKLIDTTFFCQAPRFILLDSDVLFFRHPRYLLHLAQEEAKRIHLLRDYQDSYSIDQETSQTKLGISLPSAINTGLAVISKDSIDFDILENILKKNVIPMDKDGFAEQTLLALIASLIGYEYFPDDYKVVTGRSADSADDTFRHYVGPVKNLFFDEGVPHFVKALSLRGLP